MHNWATGKKECISLSKGEMIFTLIVYNYTHTRHIGVGLKNVSCVSVVVVRVMCKYHFSSKAQLSDLVPSLFGLSIVQAHSVDNFFFFFFFLFFLGGKLSCTMDGYL